MTSNFKKTIFLLFIGIINTQCQNMKTTQPIDVSKAIIKIDSCGLYYNNQRLDLGTPYAEWEKVLGKYDREIKGSFIWDKLGLTITIFWDNDNNMKREDYGTYKFIIDRPVIDLSIHFLNLNSPQGQAGELNHARGWKPFDESNWESDYLKENGERLKEEANPKNQVYPFTLYKGYVNLHGFPVGAGMQVKEINSYRKELPFSGEFRYVDDDIDGVNDSGNTTDTFGGDYRAGGTECLNKRLQYYELTYTASGALEYLKIGYEDQGDFENRKEREKLKN